MHFVHFEMEICIKTGKILFTFPQRGFEMVLSISTVSFLPTCFFIPQRHIMTPTWFLKLRSICDAKGRGEASVSDAIVVERAVITHSLSYSLTQMCLHSQIAATLYCYGKTVKRLFTSMCFFCNHNCPNLVLAWDFHHKRFLVLQYMILGGEIEQTLKKPNLK